MAKKFLFPFLITLILFSCGNTNQTEQIKQESRADSSDMSSPDSLTETNLFPEPTRYVATDTQQTVSILLPESYHDGEFPAEYERKQWVGIFLGDRTYLSEQTEVKFERVNDPIMDATEEDKTGWQISVENDQKMCLFLLSGLHLKNENIQHVEIKRDQIFPGDTVKFTFNKTEYLLFASGKKQVDSLSEFYPIIENYSLFIQAKKGNSEITQLLFSNEYFDETMSYLMFVGDIDQDGIPDLLINTTHHYNVSNPSLFLSSPADENHLYNLVGWITSTGC